MVSVVFLLLLILLVLLILFIFPGLARRCVPSPFGVRWFDTALDFFVFWKEVWKAIKSQSNDFV